MQLHTAALALGREAVLELGEEAGTRSPRGGRPCVLRRERTHAREVGLSRRLFVARVVAQPVGCVPECVGDRLDGLGDGDRAVRPPQPRDHASGTGTPQERSVAHLVGHARGGEPSSYASERALMR